MSYFSIVLDHDHYYSFLKIAAGYGIVAKSFNLKYNFSFSYSPLAQSALIGVGYDVESQSIPISIDVYKFLNNSEAMLLVGIKVPLFDIGF